MFFLRNWGRLQSSLWLGLLPAAALLLLLIAPLARLTLTGFTGEASWPGAAPSTWSLWTPWQDDYLRWRVLWSLAQAGITCVLAFVLGLPLAWVLARFDFAGRTLVLRLLMLPFVVPTLVAALGVLALWGPRGLLSGWLGVNLQETEPLEKLPAFHLINIFVKSFILNLQFPSRPSSF